ncbi:hypothetical protein EBB07_29405 [Paenibacillaceae bacterium]|nr:hypothetical protein EBB07_29405 [Paenibacillaceae bacterium]
MKLVYEEERNWNPMTGKDEYKGAQLRLVCKTEAEWDAAYAMIKDINGVIWSGCPSEDEKTYSDTVVSVNKALSMTIKEVKEEVSWLRDQIEEKLSIGKYRKAVKKTEEVMSTSTVTEEVTIAEVENSNGNVHTVFHASHNGSLTFEAQEVTNYNKLGTWFTSSPDKARSLYGPNVYTVKVTLHNPLYAHTDNFDDFFLCKPLAFKYIGTETPSEKQMTSLLLNANYMSEWKSMIMKAGYDAIVFEDSKIDLPISVEETHTVYIVFDHTAISLQ